MNDPEEEREARYYGIRACQAVFAKRPEDVQRLFLTEAAMREVGDVMRTLARLRRPYHLVEEAQIEKVSGTRHHEGVCLLATPARLANTTALMASIDASPGPARFLYLDGVDNPHNIGALLRTAAHFGALAIAGHAEDVPSPTGAVARVAEGAAEHVPLLPWKNPKKGLDALRDRGFVRVATVVEGGRDLYEVELPERCVFLLGAEHAGLGPSARAIADLEVTIPGTGAVESLNVATAGAVLLAEHFRRHRP